jgi:hypothetical protein
MADQNTQTREDLEAMDEGQLKSIADSRGITVTASDGSDSPSVDDYVEALEPPDEPFGGEPSQDERVAEGDKRARSAQQAAGKPSKKMDETVPGGKYINRQGKTVNAAGQVLGDDGKPVDSADEQYPDSE